MDIVLSHQPDRVSTLTLDVLVERQKIAGKSRQLLDATVGKIDGILDTLLACKPSIGASRLSAEADAAEAELAAGPTRENAEKLHDAIVRHEDAKRSFERIDRALNVALRREIDTLRPIALGVLDAVAEDFEKEVTVRRKAITDADAVFGVSGDASHFDARAQMTRAAIEGERQRIQASGAALAWLAERGFCRNPYLEGPGEG